MNIRELDLNLLLVFDAIYRERSIGAAGQKLGLSQPAVSNALRRLRDFTGDALFFRSDNTMKPTRVATALALPIAHALASVEGILTTVRQFDPETSTRHFRVGFNDLYRALLTPALAYLFEQEAPNAKLEMVLQSIDATTLLNDIRNGSIETAFIPAAYLDGTMSHKPLVDEPLVFTVRNGHPALSKPITREMLQDFRYVVTSENHTARTLIDNALRKNGIERNVACIMPDVSIIPSIVEVTDLVAITGLGFIQRHMRDHALTILKAPITLPRIKSSLVWSKTYDDDQSHKWLRSRILHTLNTAMSLNIAG
ncbi:MAG: LysR family transcriptional regulator [Rhizobiales bacterium]|nr:LysR family transcriptional regulator [Hyphomicrobiales bacterium]